MDLDEIVTYVAIDFRDTRSEIDVIDKSIKDKMKEIENNPEERKSFLSQWNNEPNDIERGDTEEDEDRNKYREVTIKSMKSEATIDNADRMIISQSTRK